MLSGVSLVASHVRQTEEKNAEDPALQIASLWPWGSSPSPAAGGPPSSKTTAAPTKPLNPLNPQGLKPCVSFSHLASTQTRLAYSFLPPPLHSSPSCLCGTHQVLRVSGDKVRAGRVLPQQRPGGRGRQVPGARGGAHRVHARVRVRGLNLFLNAEGEGWGGGRREGCVRPGLLNFLLKPSVRKGREVGRRQTRRC